MTKPFYDAEIVSYPAKVKTDELTDTDPSPSPSSHAPPRTIIDITGRLKFVHIRDLARPTKYIGTAAMFDRGLDYPLIASLSLLHPKDQFEKCRGRELCALRIFGRIGVDTAMEAGIMPYADQCEVSDLTEVYEYDGPSAQAVRNLFRWLTRYPSYREEALMMVNMTEDVARDLAMNGEYHEKFPSHWTQDGMDFWSEDEITK